MKSSDVKTYVTKVLKAWFVNKTTLDKLGEQDNTLTYNGRPIQVEIDFDVDTIIEAVWDLMSIPDNMVLLYDQDNKTLADADGKELLALRLEQV